MTDAPEPAPGPRPTIAREFTIQRDGKTFVLYAGLLDLGHQRGLKGITTSLVQVPSDVNGMTAIVFAQADMPSGAFTGLGDANPGNVTRMLAPHLIRMAETRAKARALRDAVNVGMTAVEELGDDAESGVAPAVAPSPPPPGAPSRVTAGIVVGGQRYTREQVWRAYSLRRVQALNAGIITTGDRLAGYVPESDLADLVAASQALKKRMAPQPELEPGPEEPEGERG